MFVSILVVLQDREKVANVLEAAIALAQAERARVTLMATASLPGLHLVTLLTPPMPALAELRYEADLLLDYGASLLDAHARVATTIREGGLCEAISRRVAACDHDAVVIGASTLRAGG